MKEKFLDELKKHFGHAATVKQSLMLQLSDFILSEIQDELFVIKGYAGTGKTTLVSSVIKSLSTVKFQSILLAPTGRAAKVLTQYSGSGPHNS